MSPTSAPKAPDAAPETTEASVLEGTFGPSCVELELRGTRTIVDLAATGALVVGRSSAATVEVDDERVSRRHLELAWVDGVLAAKDLGSRNGTLLNGRRLEGERTLRGGDLLEAGPLRIRAGGSRRARELLDEGDLTDRLDEEIERARAFARPLSVIGVRLEGPLAAVAHAIERISGRLGPTDLVGEWAAGQLVVLLPERALADAERLADASRTLAEEVAGVRARARAATFPEHGRGSDDLLAAALAPNGAEPASAPGRTLIVADPAMRALFETARRVARSKATVLITGPSGAGKEWVAAEIHTASPRGAGPYVRLNCAALPETLAESELFGHEKGAFTGADKRRTGRIASAHGGTLFLDEIGELPLALQAKLLRVLEDRQVLPVGGNQPEEVDVRFVCATNRDLEREAREGRFREDLYYRLSAITLEVPALSERPLDVVALAEHFVVEAARASGQRPPRMSAAFVRALEGYPWPGNVRELKNVIERAVILTDGDELGPQQLPERLRATAKAVVPPPPEGAGMKQQLDELERQSLEAALAATNGNRTHAAKQLGISRRALIYKLHKYGLAKD